MLMQPSGSGLVGEMRIDPSLAFIERGWAPRVASFRMDDLILKRGKRIHLI
jgi:hypothetical protein